MSSSTSSGYVLGQGAAGEAESVVERDGGGEREQSAGDAGSEAVQRAGAVAFEGEDVFGGPVDRFDPLADRREMGLVVVGGARVRGELGRGSQRGGCWSSCAGSWRGVSRRCVEGG